MKTSYVFLADGFEEIEAVAPVDILRRAGMIVKTVSVNGVKTVTGAHGVPYVADYLFEEVEFDDAEWLILPGGMPGATNLYEFDPLGTLLKEHNQKGGRIAAICASPAVVLAPLAILNGKKATCYPGFEKEIISGVEMTGERVVVSENVITANGPASAYLFGLAIVENSVGKATADEVAAGMLC